MGTAQLVFEVEQCGAVTSPEVASPDMTSLEVASPEVTGNDVTGNEREIISPRFSLVFPAFFAGISRDFSRNSSRF